MIGTLGPRYSSSVDLHRIDLHRLRIVGLPWMLDRCTFGPIMEPRYPRGGWEPLTFYSSRLPDKATKQVGKPLSQSGELRSIARIPSRNLN